MGLFDLFRKGKPNGFVPNLRKTEYENWITFVVMGGTSEEWEALKKKNRWKFKVDEVANFERFEKEFRPAWNRYYAMSQKLKTDWSVIYNRKEYCGKLAERFERDCRATIAAYKRVSAIEDKYRKDHLTSVDAYNRLAILYERQGEYEKSVAVCVEAIKLGNFEDMKRRLDRMIKKAGRTPTPEELELIVGK